MINPLLMEKRKRNNWVIEDMFTINEPTAHPKTDMISKSVMENLSGLFFLLGALTIASIMICIAKIRTISSSTLPRTGNLDAKKSLTALHNNTKIIR